MWGVFALHGLLWLGGAEKLGIPSSTPSSRASGYAAPNQAHKGEEGGGQDNWLSV